MKYDLNINLSSDCIYTISFVSEWVRDEVATIIDENNELAAIEKVLNLRYNQYIALDDIETLKDCANGLIIVFRNKYGLR